MIANARRVDVMSTIAMPLAVTVSTAVVGVPDGDGAFLSRLLDDAMRPVVDEASARRLSATITEMCEYVLSVVPFRRRHPGPDLLTSLIRDHDAGTLDPRDLAQLATAVLFAGIEAPASALGAGLGLLLSHPDQLAAVRESPSLLPDAVEELICHSGPVEALTRYSACPIDHNGVRIPAGMPILLCIGVANHDPARFPEPQTLDIGRQDNQHLGFGWGPHYCPGAPLGRLLVAVGLEAVLRRLEGLALAVPFDRLQHRDSTFVHGIVELPVTFDRVLWRRNG